MPGGAASITLRLTGRSCGEFKWAVWMGDRRVFRVGGQYCRSLHTPVEGAVCAAGERLCLSAENPHRSARARAVGGVLREMAKCAPRLVIQ